MIVGTTSWPCGVAPDDRRRAAARSEHPFETALVEPGGALEVLDDLDDAAADRRRRASARRPRRRSGRRVWSARRARYSFGSADRPVAATLPPVSSGRVHGLGVWQTGRLARPPERCLARPLRPVVEALGHPAPDAARARRRPGRRRRGAEELPSARAVASATASRVGRPAIGIGSPTLTRTRPPKRSQLVPLMAIGTSGTPERRAK